MEAIDFPESNDILKCGNNPNCNDLPIFRGRYIPIGGNPNMVEIIPITINKNNPSKLLYESGHFTLSVWEEELTEEQIQEIISTRKLKVYFQATGFTHPPIYIYSRNPGLPSNSLKDKAE